MATREPQSFALVLEESDGGEVDKIISRKWGELIEYLTDKASLHDSDWKGSMALKIKVVAEPRGKVTLTFSSVIQRDEEKLPRGHMYYNPETHGLQRDEPKQLKIKGFDDDGRATRQAKSAAAPKQAGESKEE